MRACRFTSFLYLNAPQRQHIYANSTALSHPVSVEITDYCCKMDRQHLTNIPISNVRLPVWSLIPNTIDRFVFDEVIADNELFMNMHNNKTIQEIQLNPIRQSLDNIACDIVAGAHHGSCKLVYSTGSVGSGHGPLVFGVSNNEVPEVGLLWSILDALQVDQDWP